MKKARHLILFFVIVLLPQFVYASTSVFDRLLPPIQGVDSEGRKLQTLPSGDFKLDLIPRMLGILFALSGAVITAVFVYAGVMLVTSAGNEEAVTKFKKAMVYSGVGLLIIITAYGIVFGILKLEL